MAKSPHAENAYMLSQSLINKFEMRMIPIFMKLLAISMDASNVFGCSNSATIRLNDGCFRVFNTLISFDVSEKKATSLPEIKKENMNRIKSVNISTVVAAGVIASK